MLSSYWLFYYPSLHLLSLLSSSFIEEEHQLWYLFIQTFLILALRDICVQLSSNKRNIILMLITITFIFRLLRSWNQTGNKWLTQPDIGDYLNSSDNRQLLFIVHFFSLLLFVLMQTYMCKQRLLSLIISSLLSSIILFYRWTP
ncbi:unnamed protein product, partial [Didymodactylos carnosus]